jgi:hypothetical protein
MNCDDIQTRLSEYLEKSLDTISMKGIEVHLSSCSRCRVEADGLAECIQQVTGLPMVDLPLGFSQRVMAHVREIDEKPTFWKRLFFPLRLKIPLQATAVVLIGALAVVLSQNEQQFEGQESSERGAAMTTSAVPSEKKNEPSKDSTIGVARSVQDQKPAESTVKPIAELAKQSTKQMNIDKAPASPAPDQARPAPVATAKLEGESRLEDKKETRRRPPIQAQEVATGRESLRSSSDAFGVGALRHPSLRSPPFVAGRSLSPLSEPSADVEFVVRRRPRERVDQKETGGSDAGQTAVLKRASPASQTNLITEIRWFTVTLDRFEEFKKELAAEATIESEKAPGVIENDFAQKTGRELVIKVNILSP